MILAVLDDVRLGLCNERIILLKHVLLIKVATPTNPYGNAFK